MKREDQIKKFMDEESIPEPYQGYVLDGIAWADEHPNKAWLDKACEFFKSYRQETPDGMGYIAGIVNDETIEDFRKYMEEQQ